MSNWYRSHWIGPAVLPSPLIEFTKAAFGVHELAPVPGPDGRSIPVAARALR